MGSKRDARKRRRKQQRKKEIPTSISPVLEKTPRESVRVAPAKDIPDVALKPSKQKMTLDLSMADREGSWSWGVVRDWGQEVWSNTIQPFLGDYTTKTWGQIDAETTGPERRRRRKHVYYGYDVIKTEALNRLEELQIDDIAPNIFRFRISGKKRLYGFRIDPRFHLLWYDPTHEIIKPSRK